MWDGLTQELAKCIKDKKRLYINNIYVHSSRTNWPFLIRNQFDAVDSYLSSH